jgi:hypothetical protein
MTKWHGMIIDAYHARVLSIMMGDGGGRVVMRRKWDISAVFKVSIKYDEIVTSQIMNHSLSC